MERHGRRLSRRQVVLGMGITGAGLLAGCGRLPWQADAPRVARVGFLGLSNASSPNFEVFRQGLRELNWVEGQSLIIEVRWAEGRSEWHAALAAELAGLQPEVIVTSGPAATQATMQATSTIPIVFSGVFDPVGLGLVASLAHPGGNATGLSNFGVAMNEKRLELLKATVPNASHVVALWDPTITGSTLAWEAIQETARTLGLTVQAVEIHGADDLAGAFDIIARDRADALIVPTSGATITVNTMPRLPDFVARSRLPGTHQIRADVAAGGLMFYGPSLAGQYHRMAYYVDRILRGAKPADLPVERPMTFDFVVNLKTARELGITFPNEIMLQVTDIVQ